MAMEFDSPEDQFRNDRNVPPADPGEGSISAGQVDYFGFSDNADRKKFMLPDGISFIEYARLDEGAKTRYQERTQGDLTLDQRTNKASVRMNPGRDRHELLKAASKGWNLIRGGKPFSWTPGHFEDWLRGTDPLIVEDFEKAIRKDNPWLLAEMSVADIDREIMNLQEMREVAAERERGE